MVKIKIDYSALGESCRYCAKYSRCNKYVLSTQRNYKWRVQKSKGKTACNTNK